METREGDSISGRKDGLSVQGHSGISEVEWRGAQPSGGAAVVPPG